MSDPTAPEAIPTPQTEAAAQAAETATPPPPETGAEPTAAKDPLEEAQAEVLRWKDQAYRQAAELDNFRKRMAREAQESRAYANADLLRGLLPVLDSFEMGLEAARAESEKSMIFMGMSMVQRQIMDFLREQGVQEVEALGKAFDPMLHEAVSTEVNATVPEGQVLRVTRRGFRLRERLLRAASVIVAAPAAEADATTATDAVN